MIPTPENACIIVATDRKTGERLTTSWIPRHAPERERQHLAQLDMMYPNHSHHVEPYSPVESEVSR